MTVLPDRMADGCPMTLCLSMILRTELQQAIGGRHGCKTPVADSSIATKSSLSQDHEERFKVDEHVTQLEQLLEFLCTHCDHQRFLTVAVDSRGSSIHETGPREWRMRIGKIPVVKG